MIALGISSPIVIRLSGGQINGKANSKEDDYEGV